MKRIILANLIALAFTVGAFDLVCYFALPDRFVTAFADYRRTPEPTQPGIAGWPHDYYVADPELGFDIGANKRGQHWVDGLLYPIRSNSLGCFDDEPGRDYVYFAGDSFLWGYAPWEQRWATLIERETGTDILSCGVEHTGQRHQLAKLQRIASRAGLPKAVFVFFFENDVVNDYAYPHSTVVDGWLMDDVLVDEQNQLLHQTGAELAARLREGLARYENAEPEDPGLKATIKRYSLSANLANATVDALSASAEAITAGPASAAASGPRTIYALPYQNADAFHYLESPYAKENQAALVAFRDWATANAVPLTVVLIPRRRPTFDPDWYHEVHGFLRANSIAYFDLTTAFIEMDVDPTSLYWRGNAHFNSVGNRAVADAMVAAFPVVFDAGR